MKRTHARDVSLMVDELETYRSELVKRGQANELDKEYVRVVADMLGAILRRFHG